MKRLFFIVSAIFFASCGGDPFDKMDECCYDLCSAVEKTNNAWWHGRDEYLGVTRCLCDFGGVDKRRIFFNTEKCKIKIGE